MSKYGHLNTEEDIYKTLFSVAVAALEKKGMSALEYLYANPTLSLFELSNLQMILTWLNYLIAIGQSSILMCPRLKCGRFTSGELRSVS